MHHTARPVLSGREAQLQHHPGAHQLPPAQCSRSMAVVSGGGGILNASALHVSCPLIQTIRSSSCKKKKEVAQQAGGQSADVERRKQSENKETQKTSWLWLKRFTLFLSTGMVSRLKYIVSDRARPPSTAGLGYGQSQCSHFGCFRFHQWLTATHFYVCSL